MIPTTRKYKDAAWDFRRSPTKEFTHCFHNYPAMMIPQIARTLLERYGAHGGWLLDPYCGTGTSLVEASMFGMNAIGCDINPLVRLIAKAKTTPIPLNELDDCLENLREYLFEDNTPHISSAPPPILNRSYWFSGKVIERLAVLREYIQSVSSDRVQNFLWVAFSETVRECSYTKNGEFKLVRMPADKLLTFDPDVFTIFMLKLLRNRAGLSDYLAKRRNVEISVGDANTSTGNRPQHPRPFDLVITSPPYGDSSTTVAYGQFSRLSAQWIGLPNKKVDRISMGGATKKARLNEFPVTNAIRAIEDIDYKRSQQVEAYYIDLSNSIRTVSSMMAERSTVCYIVGNRTVKGVTLPTDEFVVSAFEDRGFEHLETIVRNIPNKRMPSKNSPSNIAGKTQTTMRQECVVICRRQARSGA